MESYIKKNVILVSQVLETDANEICKLFENKQMKSHK